MTNVSLELRVDILQDDPDTIRHKLAETQRRNQILLPGLIEEEMQILDRLVKKLNSFLTADPFTGRMGRQIYHFNTERDEVYVSPDIFYSFDGHVFYEVYEKEKYLRVARSANITDLPADPVSNRYRGYCKVPLRNFMEIVPLEEIARWLSAFVNLEHDNYRNIAQRSDFIGRSVDV